MCPEFWNQTITEMKLSRKELIDDVSWLAELMQFDFVFIKPCDNLDNIIDTVIRHFEEEQIILVDMVLNNSFSM